MRKVRLIVAAATMAALGYSGLAGSQEGPILIGASIPITGNVSNFGQHSRWGAEDRKSTRLNSSHVAISYAVFCLKKQNLNFIVIQSWMLAIYLRPANSASGGIRLVV